MQYPWLRTFGYRLVQGKIRTQILFIGGGYFPDNQTVISSFTREHEYEFSISFLVCEDIIAIVEPRQNNEQRKPTLRACRRPSRKYLVWHRHERATRPAAS